MIAEVVKLEENMRADFPNTELTFGRTITFTKINKAVEDIINSGSVAIRFDYQDVNSEMSQRFKTPAQTVPVAKPATSVKDLVGIIAVAHKNDKLCIQLLHSVLMTLGYVDETNAPGLPAKRPWVYRDLTFFGIVIPAPGLITSAYKTESGDFYEVVQPVNIAFRITT